MTAHAVPTTYEFTLTPTALGSPTPIFGISSLPAGPFLASITFPGPLPPLLDSDQAANALAFSATVGTQSWGLADVTLAFFSTDAGGEVTAAEIVAKTPLAGFEILFNVTANVGWTAFLNDCDFSSLPLVVTGTCIAGDPSAVKLSVVAAAPEPASLMLLGVAVAGLGICRRYRSRSLWQAISRSGVIHSSTF